MTDPRPAIDAPKEGTPPPTNRRAIPARLKQIHDDFLTQLKDPLAWEKAVQLYYSLPSGNAFPVAKEDTGLASATATTIVAASKVLESFKTTLNDERSWPGWWLELHTRLGHLAGVQPILAGGDVELTDAGTAELDRALAPLISTTLGERLRHVVVDSIVHNPSATTLIRRLRQHLIPDAEQRAEAIKSQLLSFRQGHMTARAAIEHISKLVTGLESFTTPLRQQEQARILHSVPQSNGVRIKLYELYHQTLQLPESERNWSATIDKMSDWFRLFGEPAPPTTVTTTTNAAPVHSSPHPATVPRLCNYRHCSDSTPHPFHECVAFAQRVAAGTEVPHRDTYRYRGSTPVPGLQSRWIAKQWAPARARQVTTAPVSAGTTESTTTVADVGILDD